MSHKGKNEKRETKDPQPQLPSPPPPPDFGALGRFSHFGEIAPHPHRARMARASREKSIDRAALRRARRNSAKEASPEPSRSMYCHSSALGSAGERSSERASGERRVSGWLHRLASLEMIPGLNDT